MSHSPSTGPGELDDDGYVIIYGEEGKTYEIQIN